MDIGEVVKRSGLPASTLRYYEQLGLIQSTGRNGLRRTFDVSVLELLALITLGRNAGFSLKEIAKMLLASGPKIDRTQLSLKADHIDRTIKQLVSMRDGLRHASQCSSPSHLECPQFRRLLEIAIKRQKRKTHQ